MKESLLQKEIEEQGEKLEEKGLKIKGKKTEGILKDWRNDMKAAKQSEKKENKNNQDIKKIFEIREKNRPLTSLLKGKIGYQRLEDYPQEAVLWEKN
ncbi:5335_t:CDS:2 [Ambispora gerdemannii]|uniref:5335_t:CDS:1 n=1 Tax=Ambispora gerdemannii TaxID=144530 RepID=A0A9N9BSR4_9GLOM|nr:5335_t:CDS:2 [Ambispora gerdemannii]